MSFFGETVAKQRHEGRIERAFGKQAAEKIGKLERDEKGIGDQAGPQCSRHQNVTNKSEDPAAHGPAANRRNRAEERHVRVLEINCGKNMAARALHRLPIPPQLRTLRLPVSRV